MRNDLNHSRESLHYFVTFLKKVKAHLRLIFIVVPLISSLIFILFGFKSTSNKISGVIKNGSLNLSFARIRVKATSIFTTSDINGKFTLDGINSTDSVTVTAWAEGYYNGQAKTVAGDTNIVIVLDKLPSKDNSDYQFVSPEKDITDPLNCVNCHASALMNQWRNDAHGKSAVNPFFIAMYNGTDINGNPNKGVGYKLDFPQTAGNCATCHIPTAALNNPYNANPNVLSGIDRHGISCDFCHKIFKVNQSTGQGSTGTLSIEMLRPPPGEQMFFGPYEDIHKPDAYLPLIKRSEYCAPCHTGKFWGNSAYNSFFEWQESQYPSKGFECQTCHMKPDGIMTNFAPGNGGVERDPSTIPSHLMTGSRDTTILKNSVSMKISVSQIKDTVKVMVTINNDKTGHHVPSDHSARNMILLVSAKTLSGNSLQFIKGEKVPSWGGIGNVSNGNYYDLPGKGFAKIFEDISGISPAPQWRPGRILSDNRIKAFSTDTSFYYFIAPSVMQTVNVNASLIFRRFYKSWMEEKNFDIPDIVMNNETVKLSTTSVKGIAKSMNEISWLDQNYPNPFNSSTVIRFGINSDVHVTIKLFNVTGKEISVLVDKYLSKGNYYSNLDALNLSSGIYFYKMSAGNWSTTKKLLILK